MSLTFRVGSEKLGIMTGTGIQKFAYVALIVILFGVSSGWLGAL